MLTALLYLADHPKKNVSFVVSLILILISAIGYHLIHTYSIFYTEQKHSKSKKISSIPGFWYLGDKKALDDAKRRKYFLDSLYYSLTIQSTVGPPIYPPNDAWKIVTGSHIIVLIFITIYILK